MNAPTPNVRQLGYSQRKLFKYIREHPGCRVTDFLQVEFLTSEFGVHSANYYRAVRLLVKRRMVRSESRKLYAEDTACAMFDREAA